MKIVVDTNILFSFFWKDSVTRKLLLTSIFELISTETAIKELKKYSKQIISKVHTSEREFYKELKNLKSVVKFTKKEEYSNFIKQAELFSPDRKDADFLALCIKHSCVLWSNDSFLKKQNKVKVLDTKEIIELLF